MPVLDAAGSAPGANRHRLGQPSGSPGLPIIIMIPNADDLSATRQNIKRIHQFGNLSERGAVWLTLAPTRLALTEPCDGGTRERLALTTRDGHSIPRTRRGRTRTPTPSASKRCRALTPPRFLGPRHPLPPPHLTEPTKLHCPHQRNLVPKPTTADMLRRKYPGALNDTSRQYFTLASEAPGKEGGKEDAASLGLLQHRSVSVCLCGAVLAPTFQFFHEYTSKHSALAPIGLSSSCASDHPIQPAANRGSVNWSAAGVGAAKARAAGLHGRHCTYLPAFLPAAIPE
eukprot:1258804-Rhodomonas_salina.2